MTGDTTGNVVPEYLARLDAQREALFTALTGLDDDQLWQRPAAGEWCSGEILSHTVRYWHSFLLGIKLWWALLGWFGRLRRNRPYPGTIDDVNLRPSFPMWTGFLWPPRHTPDKPVPLARLQAEIEAAHGQVRAFYAGKDPGVLGNVYALDPTIGLLNMITVLKVGIDHDRLHYADVDRLVAALRADATGPDMT